MDNSQFAKEFMQEAGKKGSKKSMADIIGMPDEVDKDYIRKLIMKYEKKHPGYIMSARNEAKKEYEAQGGRKQKFGEVNKSAHGRLIFELPEELHMQIERAYPTMFRDTKHFHWFVKNFKELLVPEKY